MIRSSSYSNDIPTRVVHTIMHKADLDDSGYLDYPEFVAMVFSCFVTFIAILFLFKIE